MGKTGDSVEELRVWASHGAGHHGWKHLRPSIFLTEAKAFPHFPTQNPSLVHHRSNLPEKVCLGEPGPCPEAGKLPYPGLFISGAAVGHIPGLQAAFQPLHQQQLSAFLPLGSSKAQEAAQGLEVQGSWPSATGAGAGGERSLSHPAETTSRGLLPSSSAMEPHLPQVVPHSTPSP